MSIPATFERRFFIAMLACGIEQQYRNDAHQYAAEGTGEVQRIDEAADTRIGKDEGRNRHHRQHHQAFAAMAFIA
ncbi:hypothetical protein D3C77_598160 [compost metagenome]